MKQLPNTRWIALGEALSLLEDRGIQESAIFEAARDERGEMRGAKQRGGNPEHPIAAKYFNTPRRPCGSGRDTLEIGNEVDQDSVGGLGPDRRDPLLDGLGDGTVI